MKKTAMLLSLLMAASLVTACGSDDDSSDTKEDTVSSAAESVSQDSSQEGSAVEDSSEDESSEEESSEGEESMAEEGPSIDEIVKSDVNDSVELSDNLYDFEFAVDGEKLTLPISYADLTAKGWEFEGDAEQGIPKDNYLLAARFKKGESYIGASPANFVSEGDVKVKDSLSYQFSFNIRDSYKPTMSAVKLSKDIKLGVSTLSDVKAAYGDPTDETTDDYGNPKLTYKESYMVFYKLTFNENDVLEMVSVDNMKDVAE